jgi:uncharacterized iron-regulated membrane protein
MSISGSILVFSEEMETAADHQFKNAENPSGAYSYDASLSFIRQIYPDYEIRLYDHPGKNETLVYELRKKETAKKVFVHPTTGRILHVIEESNNQLHRQLLLFHYTFFSATAGKIFVVLIGILFLISTITGTIIYRRAIWKTITFKRRIHWKTARGFYSSLHRNVGVWSLLFNLFIIISGLALSIQIALAAIKTPSKTTAKTSVDNFSLDAMREKVFKSDPEFQIHLIRLRSNSHSIQFSGRYPGDPKIFGDYASYIMVNAETQQIERVQIMDQLPAGKQLMLMAAPFHFGNYGGLPLKIIYCFFGFMPAVLSLTGFLIWRKKVQKEKRLSAGKYTVFKKTQIKV